MASKICAVYSSAVMATELATFFFPFFSFSNDFVFLCIHTLLCQLKMKVTICRYSTPNHYISTVNTAYSLYCIFCSLHFRKMQEGDVGASNSDLQTDRADDDITHMPERCVQKMAPCFQQETCKELSQRYGVL